MYRPEIDGLRAIAIVAVVFYHANFKFAGIDLFKGGFVGVDVFFVISGYLIASIIFRDLNQQAFSFWNFYERRARRIFPALLFVIITSSVLAWALLDASSISEFSGSAIASLFFYSNFYFLGLDSYTAEPSALKPLLHTWSLAVEEQFYLFFPPLVLWFSKLSRRCYQSSLLYVLFILSLASTQWVHAYWPDANFYLITGRVWELMSGAFLAVRANKINGFFSGVLSTFLALIGLLMLLGSVIFMDHHMQHPGLVTLFPVAGTMLLIVFTMKDNWVKRLLSASPVVFLGLISYSLYLWHQPVFAFSRVASIEELVFFDKAELVVLSGLLAILSWHFIEKPFRVLNKVSLKSFCITVFSLLFFTVAFFVWGTQAEESPLSKSLLADVKRGVVSKEGKPCYGNSVNNACILGDDSSVPSFAILGDSHALTLSEPLSKLLKANGRSAYLYTMNGCPFIGGVLRRSYDRPCDEHVDAVFTKIIEHGVESVIINDRRNAYILGRMFDNQEGGVEKGDPLVYSVEKGVNSSTRVSDVLRLQRDTIMRLLEMGVTVYLILPIPEVGFHVPKTLRKIIGTKRYPLTTMSSLYFERNKDIFLLVKSLKKENLFVPIFPHKALCEKVPGRCVTHSEREVYYTDDNHLSLEGGALLVDSMRDIVFPKP